METPQMRAPTRPYDFSRQRMLAIVTATLGLLLGGLAGIAVAAEQVESPAATHESGRVAPADTPDAAAPTDELLWTQTPMEASGELPLMPLIIKVSFGLGLVVMLAWGTVYLLRRTTLGQGMSSSSSAIRVLDRNWLGPKKAIYLVDISGRTLALGVTEEHISALSTWEAGEIDVSRLAPQPGNFANQFKTMLQRRRGTASATTAGS